MERQRRAVMAARLMLIEGVIQRSEDNVVHLMVKRVIDRTLLLERLSDQDIAGQGDGSADASPERPRMPMRSHPRNVRVIPRSRDFH
jgi:error-prone DNA polymerase